MPSLASPLPIGERGQGEGLKQAMTVEVKAELVGSVWKITAKPGDQVAEEDTLLILESMKMEIPVTAPRAGTVKEIRVQEKDVVKEGQVLVVLE
jgi:acetyl-CoA carboxylase biotin carboxyl carrier protein